MFNLPIIYFLSLITTYERVVYGVSKYLLFFGLYNHDQQLLKNSMKGTSLEQELFRKREVEMWNASGVRSS